MHFSQQIVEQEQNLSLPMSFNQTDQMNNSNTTSIMTLSDNNQTEYVRIQYCQDNGLTIFFSLTNESSLVLQFSSSVQHDFSWQFKWNFIILLASGLIFIVFLINVGIWYWCKQVNHLSRRRSLPFTVDDFIETTKIQEKRLSNSPKSKPLTNIPPPVPPRPTAYTTNLGKIEYRSNL